MQNDFLSFSYDNMFIEYQYNALDTSNVSFYDTFHFLMK